MPYKPGAGLTIKLGDVDLNVSGIVNAFYTYSSADKNSPSTQVAGGLTDASGFDSSSVRNGLLPGALIVSASTTQDGIDLAAVFGVYPGINSSTNGPLNANSGGHPTALSTAGVDFRKTYITAGTPTFGTIKLGRDIGLFGQDAILNDQTLLGVGATGSNADPGNTSLGRIGYGYIYADFMPQITYISPTWKGFQGSIGVFQPLSTLNFAGNLSGTSDQHSAPMVQGRLTYDYKADNWSTHIWTGFVTQNEDNIITPNGNKISRSPIGGEGGALVNVGTVGLLAYYYITDGVGTTGLLSDGISPSGQLRGSEGGYVQAYWKPIPKLKLIGSYGESSLYLAPGEYNPDLVRRNESETGGAYYSMTQWLTLVGEYTHTDSKGHGPYSASANSVSAGAILFY
jgi:predicted porin